jgi:O-antigen ligase/Flp pilus assembly protein TadD
MPLIVSGNFIFPFIFPKQAFFQIVVEILLGLYLILALRQPQFRPRSSKFLWAIFAYFLIMILSAVFGVSTYHSFWSNYERMAGVISLWHYLAFLFVAANIFKTKEDWYRFFDFSIIASLIEAFYGFGQLFGVAAKLATGARVDGTIGNASFLGGYMLVNALFAFWLLLEKKNINWRIFYVVAMAIDLFILYETQTRGAMLALIFGLFILAIFFIFAPQRALAQMPFRRPETLKKYAIAAILLLFISAGLAVNFRGSSFIKSHPTISRLANISFQETTSRTRLLAWKMSLKGFKERPIFGWGMENYNVLFNKYYDPDLYPVESWFDRAHNAFLDVLVHTGLIGFTAYGLFFILAFWSLWRAWFKEKINYQTAVIFSVIIFSYAIQNFFVFDTQVTLLMIYSTLAFICFLAFSVEKEAVSIGQSISPNTFFGLIVFLIIFFLIYFVNVKPGLAGSSGIKALYYLQENRTSEAAAQFKSSYEIGTFGLAEVAARAYDSTMQILNNSKITESNKKEMVNVASEGLKKSLELEPLNARYMMMLGNLYLAASYLDQLYLEEADIFLSRAFELSQTRQELCFALGQLRIFQGRNEEGLALFKKAVDLNEKVGTSHWNYGLIAIIVGQKDLGEAEIKKAIELGHSYGKDDIGRLISAYSRTNDWSEIIALYEQWIKKTPDDPAAYAGLAATYAQMGDKQKAKEYAQRAMEIDPSFKADGEQFIKSLGL